MKELELFYCITFSIEQLSYSLSKDSSFSPLLLQYSGETHQISTTHNEEVQMIVLSLKLELSCGHQPLLG